MRWNASLTRTPAAVHASRHRMLATLSVVTLVAGLALFGRSAGAGQIDVAEPLPGPIGHHGRWLTDTDGRGVLFHGVNFVAKVDGETPAEMGFGADDAQWLADNGFDVVRLGLTAGSIMPSPGIIDTAYLESFRATVDILTDHGLLVLLDLHQDGWGPSLGDDGFPEWMTITHGAEDSNTDFPLYYITNPAIQAAFDSFWGNEPGPEGVNLQDRVAAMFGAWAESLGDNPGVLGYDLLNEPWPGTTWQPCATDRQGCPVQDQALDSYYARMTTAIRAQDPDRLIFGEPYVLFNFGTAPTNIGLPGDDPKSGMSYHMYTLDPGAESAVQNFAVQWADRTCGALLNTEFGATDDAAVIDRQVSELDSALVPWTFWAYNENIAGDMSLPVGETPVNEAVVGALVRPHPRAVAGTPLFHEYDQATRSLQFVYTTTRAAGGSWPSGTLSEFQVASRTYPEGYEVEVLGGRVTSASDAEVLTVEADPGAGSVTVNVFPAGAPVPDPTYALAIPEDPCATPVSDGSPNGSPSASPAVEPSFTG
jgi:endoglycosylceramidase